MGSLKKRKEINDRLVQWILKKVKAEYAGDISLIVAYGSYVNGTSNSRSDLDCYFIPKTQRGYNLAVDFIIDGVGYDLFPISWERAEGIADLRETLLPLIGDAAVLYYGDESDLERFHALQERQKRNLKDDEYIRGMVEQRCQIAGESLAMLDPGRGIADIRRAAGEVILFLADSVALHHNDYYHFGLKRQFEDLRDRFSEGHGSFSSGYESVVKAGNVSEIIKCTTAFFEDVCAYLRVAVTPQKAECTAAPLPDMVDGVCLAGMYEEICSTFNKIYLCCESGNYILAFISAVCLQRDFDCEREAGCPAYPLLRDFDYRNLSALADTAKMVEADLIRLITENGGRIKKFDSFDEFEAANL